jgi:glycosyltransferase involved in cell wall biosynthesis
MKIAFIGTKGINIKGTAFGGFETVITELAPRFVNNGHEVIVYCRTKLYTPDSYPNEYKGVHLKFLTSIETKNFGTMSHSFLAVLHSIIKGYKVAFLFNLGLGIYIPLLKLFGFKIVTNLDGVEWERSKWGGLAKFMFKLGAYLNVKWADILVSDAKEIRNIYLQKFGKDSVVIPYGAEIRNDLSPCGIEKFGLVPNSYWLLATRFIPENNPLFVIKSFLKANSNKKLVVLGQNYYNSTYEREIKKINDPRILFLGHLSDRKLLLEFYKYSYGYIHAHSVGGTNPSMLEALANSSCILAHDNVFNKEMLDNGNYGMFFRLDENDFVNKLLYLENNAQEVAEYKLKAPERIHAYYNWELVSKKYLKTLTLLTREN